MNRKLLLAILGSLVLVLGACAPAAEDADMTDMAEGDTMMEGEMAEDEMVEDAVEDTAEAVVEAGEEVVDEVTDENNETTIEGDEVAEELMDEDMAEGEMMDDMAEEAMEPNIVEVAQGAGTFNTLVSALQISGLDQTLVGEGPFTVFAPTDEAFAAFLETSGMTEAELLTSPDLQDILLYHVVDGLVMAEDVVAMTSGTTVQGADLSIAASDAGVMLNDGVNVVQTDIIASNGVVHVIDAVLVPPM